MSDSPPDSLIPYDEIVQDALRAVVQRVLGTVESEGLPGDHHFYITFKTRAPGVSIPAALMARFPDEMTIVLQNKFWDLNVSEEGFEVGLSFNQVPSHLVVPFGAITAFVDPAVDFALHFQVDAVEGPEELAEAPNNDADDSGSGETEATSDGDADGSNVVTVDFGKKR